MDDCAGGMESTTIGVQARAPITYGAYSLPDNVWDLSRTLEAVIAPSDKSNAIGTGLLKLFYHPTPILTQIPEKSCATSINGGWGFGL
jgi:hypothetical protein